MIVSWANSKLIKSVLLLYLITVWGVFVFLNTGMWANFWEVDKDYCIPFRPPNRMTIKLMRTTPA